MDCLIGIYEHCVTFDGINKGTGYLSGSEPFEGTNSYEALAKVKAMFPDDMLFHYTDYRVTPPFKWSTQGKP